MKTFRTQAGPFAERPFYTDQEIENMCSDELDRFGLLPSEPEAIRIDRFIEKRFGAPHEYQDLPPGVLGYTRFGKTGVEAIVVERALDGGSQVDERRVRTTLAHEAGHGLLHAHLFLLTGQSSLFPEGTSTSPRVMCREDQGAEGRRAERGDWWEFQANRAIGGLLLPRRLVMKAVGPMLTPAGGLGLPTLPARRFESVVQHLATVFDVNPIVARIRLQGMFPEEAAGQPML